MPRGPRLLLNHSFYHIMARGNNKNIVFKNHDDYLYYLDQIRRFKKIDPFDLFHYCLMPTHVHFQVQIQNSQQFSNFMKKLNLAYFHYYRKKYSWIGHFWQDRFKSQPIGKDAYFIQCGKYIELNPIRKKIVTGLKDYPYSSYLFYAFGKKNDLITEDIFYSSMGKTLSEKQSQYKKLIISDIILDSYQKKAWGSPLQRHNETQKIKYNL